jgi:transposase
VASRLVNINRETPMILPPDMRDWLPENHMVHFVVEAVESLDLQEFQLNQRGTGSRQYPPSMMLALLIYCYATGRFSSRAIEAASHFDVAVRYICGGEHHPDHSVICAFRTGNKDLFSECFVKVLGIAQESGALKLGTVSVDGTKIKADASKHAAVSYKKAGEMIAELECEVEQLVGKAEDADSTPLNDGLSLPEEISRRKERIETLKAARELIEERYEAARQEKAAEYEQTLADRAERESNGDSLRGPKPKPPAAEPPDKAQVNFSDPDSRIMKAGTGNHFEQAYNAQAVVDADGSYLIVGAHVSINANDKCELAPGLASIPEQLGVPDAVLADAGFYGEESLQEIEDNDGPTLYVPPKRGSHRVRVSDLEAHADPAPPPVEAPYRDRMAHRLKTAAGKEKYSVRKHTVEPVFGIIKEVLGFRQFSLRGHPKVELEWLLVCLSWNMKRLHKVTRRDLLPA